ncbi:hypothetical protein C0033_24875 [Clostridium sp. chh4-2]|uniref:sensor histidine kinase n=1 Tax=Clostridium sp. chh4-2 TaxID=2067550 RepID=UPI000CCDE6FA|nr:histidine kinase [Clostridium sp. chh4-2]PNV59297.1 hypothetical protein C0033_24875 [Clostridium sp. chh4-2]
MRWLRSNIRVRLILILCIVIVLPTILAALFSSLYIQKNNREKFIVQNSDLLYTSSQNVLTYMDTLNFSLRNVYLNRDTARILSGDSLSYQDEASMLSFLGSILSTSKGARQIYLNSYRLKTSFLVNSVEQLTAPYSGSGIKNSELPQNIKPYSAYLEPPHPPHTYGVSARSHPDEEPVVTFHWTIYQPPSVDRLLGEISLDIPVHVFERMCSSLYSQEEDFYIVDKDRWIIYSSNQDEIGTLLANGPDFPAEAAAFSFKQGILFSLPMQTKYMDWYLIKYSPDSYINADTKLLQINFLLFSVCTLIMVAFVILAVLQIMTPLKKLTKYAQAVDKEGLDIPMDSYINYKNPDEIGILVSSIHNMVDRINHMILQQYKIEITNKTNELKALQAQINPHFLYNTLQCIATSALEADAPQVYDEIAMLGQMMQYSMTTGVTLVPFRSEMNHTDSYLRLQQIRFEGSGKLHISYHVTPEALDIKVPKMILQPIIENCFKHGAILSMAEAFIHIEVFIKEKQLTILVDDSGKGITEKKLEEIRRNLQCCKETPPGSDTIGLVNVLSRVHLYYNGGGSLKIGLSPLGGVQVQLVIPYLDL